jgi:hypothetical protein
MDFSQALGYGIGMYIILMYMVSIVTAALLIVFYFFPLIQILLTKERGNWLRQQFKAKRSSGAEEDAFRADLLAAAEPEQAYPMYKFLKFVLIGGGIIAAVAGLLMIVLPEYSTSGLRKFLVFVPILVAVGVYFFYKTIFLNHGLWREIAGAFLILGFGATLMAAHEEFDLNEWLRVDILIYMILAFGLWVVFHLKSVVASFIYMIMISAFCSLVVQSVPTNGWFFLTHFIWVFAVGILYFWLPRLRAAKQIGFKEILFAILLFSNALSLIMHNTSGLVIPGLAVMLPTLYLFSKVYYKKAAWFGGRPIEVGVILLVLISAIGLCIPEFVEQTQDSITLFKRYSFHKQLAYFILVIVALTGYILYQDHENEQENGVNLLIVFFPLGAFLLVYLVGDYGTQFIVNLFLLYLGYDYLQKGIKQKDVIQLMIAVLCIVVGVFIRLEAFIEDIDQKEIIGLLIILLGALLVSIALYMRHHWSVTAPGGETSVHINDDFDDFE